MPMRSHIEVAVMKINSKVQRIALLGLFGALAAVISVAENALPPMPFMPVGAKLGLSNIILMFLIMEAGLPYALAVAIFKSTIALLTRGVTAAAMSFTGGILSLAVIYILHRFKCVGSVGLGISGAIAHNIGQLCISLVIAGGATFYYMPMLLIFAVASGTLTGIALHYIIPAMNKAIGKVKSDEKTDNPNPQAD